MNHVWEYRAFTECLQWTSNELGSGAWKRTWFLLLTSWPPSHYVLSPVLWVWWMAGLSILVPTFGSPPWLCSTLDLWIASVSSIPGDIYLLISSISWRHTIGFLPSWICPDFKKRDTDSHEGRFDEILWLVRYGVKEEENEKYLLKHYSIVCKKQEIRRAAYAEEDSEYVWDMPKLEMIIVHRSGTLCQAVRNAGKKKGTGWSRRSRSPLL